MGSLGLVAGNAFRDVLHRRVVYVVVFVAVVVVALTLSPLAFMRMAREAGELGMVERMGGSLVKNALGIWDFAALTLGLFLGTTALSSELKAKTIVTVLAKPVERSTYLLGRWLGVQLFVGLFALLGVVLGWGLTRYFALPVSILFWLGLLHSLVGAVFSCAVGFALSVVLPPVVAGMVTVLLPLLPYLTGSLREVPVAVVSILATAVYYAGPAVMPVDLVERSFDRELLDPTYGLYLRVMLENVLYAAAALLLGCLVFARREIRLG